MKDTILADKEKINYFLSKCEEARNQGLDEELEKRLLFRDKFYQQTAAHACAKNGHVAILVKIIEYVP